MIGNIKKWLGLAGAGVSDVNGISAGGSGQAYVSPEAANAKRAAKKKAKAAKKARRRNRR